MIVTEKKSFEEIARNLEAEQRLFIAGCQGCPEGAATGGEAEVQDLKNRLEGKGKEITDTVLVDFLCNKVLVGIRLSRKERAILEADAVVVVSCGVGVQATGAMVPCRVVPALNTLAMGGAQGLWPSSERCGECGECRLDATGGICPITTCSKSLLNGPCGGSKEGKCEVHSEKDCGWHMIYQRLEQIGGLQYYMRPQALRDYRKADFPIDRRKSLYWALEQEEELRGRE
jgi:hypothetical protein